MTDKLSPKQALELVLRRFSFRVYWYAASGMWCGTCDQYSDDWEACEADTPTEAFKYVLGRVLEIAESGKQAPDDERLSTTVMIQSVSLPLNARLNLLENLLNDILEDAEGVSEDELRRELRDLARSLGNFCFDKTDPRPTLPVLLYDVEGGLVCAHAVELDLTARAPSDEKALRALKGVLVRVFAEGGYVGDPSRIPYVPRPEIANRHEAARAARVRGVKDHQDRIATVGIPSDRDVLRYCARLARAGGEGGHSGPLYYQRPPRRRVNEQG